MNKKVINVKNKICPDGRHFKTKSELNNHMVYQRELKNSSVKYICTIFFE